MDSCVRSLSFVAEELLLKTAAPVRTFLMFREQSLKSIKGVAKKRCPHKIDIMAAVVACKNT